MKNRALILIIAVLSLSVLLAEAQDALGIVEKADAIFTLDCMYQKSTMTINRSGREQPVQIMESFYLKENGEGKTLTLFLEPRRVKGTAYLSVGSDLWVRFASTGRIRKMSSSARKNSAGGSDFSYSDMGEGNDGYAEKYTTEFLGKEKINDIECYVISLTPRAGSRDIYEKAVAYIAQDDYTYRQIDLYENGAHIKTMTFDDFRPLAGFQYPYRITMKSLSRNSYSTVEILEMEVNSSRVVDRIFTQSYLEAIR